MDQVVVAVVATYNRKELLCECLDALLRQTYRLYKIVVVDNASTDGTHDALEAGGYVSRDEICYLRLSKNIGGAGGFYEGMKYVQNNISYDWQWIMDDDTIPYEDSLEQLMRGYGTIVGTHPQRKVSFLASAIYLENGTMGNWPVVDLRRLHDEKIGWLEFADRGILKIHDAAFTSIAVSHFAVSKCGLPCRDFFIWGDDYEYTTRLSTYCAPAYCVSKSKALHKRINVGWIDTATSPMRIRFTYYNARNYTINTIFYNGWWKGLKYAVVRLLLSYRTIRYVKGCSKWRYEVLGVLSGLFSYRRFANFIRREMCDVIP